MKRSQLHAPPRLGTTTSGWGGGGGWLTTRPTLNWWKVFWRLIDITISNSWITFHSNNPNSEIKSQKQLRLKLAKELVLPLLDLRSSPHCPRYLQNIRGERPGTPEMCLYMQVTTSYTKVPDVADVWFAVKKSLRLLGKKGAQRNKLIAQHIPLFWLVL